MYWAFKVSGIAGKLTGHKIVYNEHGLGLWRRRYHRFIIKFLSVFADKVITSCDKCKYYRGIRDKIKPNKLQTLYNSFSNDGCEDNSRIFTKLKKKGFIIGYIGRFNKVKRLEIFIEIAIELIGKIDNFKIILVGDGPERVLIENLIQKNNLEQFFYLPGFCDELLKYYKDFDIFILPSKREAFSIALLEAGASALPALAFDVGGNSEIIINKKTGYLIQDGMIGELVEKIIYLYQNPDIKIEMGQNAKKYISENFSIKKRINKLEKLYKKILSK